MGNDINTKMGVTGIAQYKQAMSQASQSVKTLDAALKLNEKQLQATGDKEVYMQQKSKLLQQQIAAQTNVVKQGQAALSAMEKQGVNPASAAYQKMSQQVLNAQTALLGMHGDLNTVGQSAEETAQKTDKLTDSLNGINKKVSFDAVLNGIGKITDGTEAAARKVASLARDVWDTMAMAASWADSENTLAAMYGIDVETLQRMQGASRTIDTTVETIIKSQQKLKQNMVYGSDDVNEAFQKLGVSIGYVTGKENEIQVFRDSTDVFWEAGEALKTYADEVERDAMAQKIFGKSWMELMPLFQAGREEYEKTLSEQSIVTEENVNKLNQLDDALQKLDQDYQATKNTILSELAPAFTVVAGGLSDLIGQVNEYLKTEEGKEKLQALGESVTALFDGITDIEFGNAIETAGGILDSITSALGWIKDNHVAVENAIKGIGTAFILLKAAEVVGTLAQSAGALKNLLGNGGGKSGTPVYTGNGGNAPAASGGSPQTGSNANSWGRELSSVPKTFKETEVTPEKIEAKSGGSAFWSKAAEVMKGLPGLAAVLAPFVLAADAEIRMMQVEEATGKYIASEQAHVGTRLDQINAMTGDEDFEALKAAYQAFAEEIFDGSNEKMVSLFERLRDEYESSLEGGDSPLLDTLINTLGDVNEEALLKMLDRGLDGYYPDGFELADLIKNIRDELDRTIGENPQDVTVETEPEIPADAGAQIQRQLSGVVAHVPVVFDLPGGEKELDGSHANGLPFVPFDGYIAALHKGERVVPASQNKNYNNTSNVYFDHVNVNNGIDADGLAARIAEHNRRTLAGFGG